MKGMLPQENGSLNRFLVLVSVNKRDYRLNGQSSSA
jgi:hypothetical protein